MPRSILPRLAIRVGAQAGFVRVRTLELGLCSDLINIERTVRVEYKIIELNVILSTVDRCVRVVARGPVKSLWIYSFEFIYPVSFPLI